MSYLTQPGIWISILIKNTQIKCYFIYKFKYICEDVAGAFASPIVLVTGAFGAPSPAGAGAEKNA